MRKDKKTIKLKNVLSVLDSRRQQSAKCSSKLAWAKHNHCHSHIKEHSIYLTLTIKLILFSYLFIYFICGFHFLDGGARSELSELLWTTVGACYWCELRAGTWWKITIQTHSNQLKWNKVDIFAIIYLTTCRRCFRTAWWFRILETVGRVIRVFVKLTALYSSFVKLALFRVNCARASASPVSVPVYRGIRYILA